MAEARLEEEEDELRELRDTVVLRNRNPTTDRSGRNKPENRLSGQGPLSSIRAVIKRTSSRASSQSDPSRERRRPEITILSAEPLASGPWFAGAPGGFPPPPPPAQQIWGGCIPAAAQPPPSYDQVIKEKTQERVPAPAGTPCQSTTSTIATQTDFVTETPIPECSATSLAEEKESVPKKPPKPPRPSLPSKAKVPQSQTTGAEGSSCSEGQAHTDTGNHCTYDSQSTEDSSWDPQSNTEQLTAPAEAPECPSSTPQTSSASSPGSLRAQRPTPRPRTKANLQPVTREVKVQTLVRIKDDGDGGQLTPAGGEVSESKYLQELLDVFGEGNICQDSQSDHSEDESEEDNMSALHSHRNIRDKIQAFERQAGVDDGDGEPLGKPQVQPRTQVAKPPGLAPKPALMAKPSTRSFWEGNSVTGLSGENHSSAPDPTPRLNPFLAPKPQLPQWNTDSENEERDGTASMKASLLPRSDVSVIARANSFMTQEDRTSIARPRPQVQSRPSLDLGNLSRYTPASLSSQPAADIDNEGTGASNVPTKPFRVAANVASIARRPTMIRVPSKPGTLLEDEPREFPPALPVQRAIGGLVPAVTSKPSLSFKPTPQTPTQGSSSLGWVGSPAPALCLPPRPQGGKVLPPRPPPAKAVSQRPPPPQTSGPQRPSIHGGTGAVFAKQSKGLEVPRKGPVLPPRPYPGHTLYNKYTLGLPHGIAEFDYNGTNSGELSFQKHEVLLLLDEIDSRTFECQVGDTKGRVQKSYVKIITPLFDASDDSELEGGSTGLQVQALHDFTAESPEELDLRTGDVVSAVEQVDGDWYSGTCRGRSGYFPVSFVKVLPNASSLSNGRRSQPVPSAVSGPRCVARFDFDAERSDELSFSEGDVIRLKEYMDQEWARGELGGHVGIFPLNYVDIVEDLLPEPAKQYPQTKIKLPGMTSMSKIKEKPGELDPSGGEWAIALYDFTAETDHDLSLYQGDRILVMEHVDADWCLGRLRGREGLFPKTFVEFSAGQPAKSEGAQGMAKGTTRARALYDFTSESEEELSLRVGDIISGVETIDEEWLVGELRGKRGLVPKSYIQLLGEH